MLLYTDGILDARDAARRALRRGAAERAGRRRYTGATATGVVEHLRVALADFTPTAGDDVCLLAARTTRRSIGGGRRRR